MKSQKIFGFLVMAIALCVAGISHATGLDFPTMAAVVGMNPTDLAGLGATLGMLGMAGTLQTFDRATIDSTGVFFETELQRISPILIEPLMDFPFARDVDLTPLDLGDEQTGYDISAMRAVGGVNPAGKSFISARTTTIGTVNVDEERVLTPTFLWGEMFQMSIIEIERSMKLNKPLSPQLLKAIQVKWNLDTQNQVMLGDTNGGVTGIVNRTDVTAITAAAVGTGSSTLFSSKTIDQIQDDFNTLLTGAWAASGYTRYPNRVGLPPAIWTYLNSVRIPNTAESYLSYLQRTNASVQGGVQLVFVPMKELVGQGAGATNRIVAYTKAEDAIRFPRSELRPLAMQFDGLFQKQIYVGRMGAIEVPRPFLMRYMDGV